jgi:starch phosphorylase
LPAQPKYDKIGTDKRLCTDSLGPGDYLQADIVQEKPFMRPLYTFTVRPSLPPDLEPLSELANNLMWSWDHELIALFNRMDPDLWDETWHNPVMMLGRMTQERLVELAADDSFVSQLRRAQQRLNDYMTRTAWYTRQYQKPCNDPLIAYFSMEFGLTESLQIYSGGLGILSGDHLKSASDLGIPLVGVGLLYQKGYFHQYLNADGWQQENYPVNDFYNLPLTLQRDEQGDPIFVQVTYPGREVHAQIWRADVGRVQLYLLDTNIGVNSQEDQNIADYLYGGDGELRLKQEIMLGIGGVRALKALGIHPTVYHMNEGHSAFLSLERVRALMQERDLTFAQAQELAKAGALFTTHTNVPAGIDRFPADLIGRYFGHYYGDLGLNHDQFLALGRQNPNDPYEPFNMAILAFRMAAYANGVSKLHGVVARKMWQAVWPNVPPSEIPIGSITNGVHQASFISRDMASLFDRYLGPRWRETPGDAKLWSRVDRIPSAELWNTHERRRERLVSFARKRLHEQLARRGASNAQLLAAEEALNPEALTIGFARRFATYKRATLLLHDPDRLIRILSSRDRPVQIIFAGKAHPHDNPGKELIRQIVHTARREELRPRLVFLEDYDLNIARYMVQGVDVWLNTPIRPREASGTSGIKASANGVLNLSVLDGWWDEAYSPKIGWAIGRGEVYEDRNYQDHVEASALYDLLEKEVIPLFYDRGSDKFPRGWIDKMKESMKSVCPTFNTHRMLREYTDRYYIPCCERYETLSRDGMEPVKDLVAWKQQLRQHWPQVRVLSVVSDIPTETQVGAANNVTAEIHLGPLTPRDVTVELYYGTVDTNGEIQDPHAAEMAPQNSDKGAAATEGVYTFVRQLTCASSGMHGFTVRVIPKHVGMVSPFEMSLIAWG